MVQFASYLRRVLCKTRLIFPRINGPMFPRINGPIILCVVGLQEMYGSTQIKRTAVHSRFSVQFL